MSYALECLARGRVMWNELRGNFGTRRVLVVILAAPVAIFAILFALVLALSIAAPWDILLDPSGFVSGLIVVYSLTTLFAIGAPRFKFTVAAVVTIALATLSYPWPWRPPNTDFDDDTSPYAVWAGIVVGGSMAVLLVRVGLRSRWLLLLPAYFVGFLVFFILGSLLTFPFAGLLPSKAYWVACVLPIGSLGAILCCRLMAPSHRNRVVATAIVASVLLGAGIYWIGIGSVGG